MNDSRIAPVFQILAEDIHALGVRTVFGLMSDDTAVFAVTLDGLGVKFVGARHENNAIAMAEGYAYATGELGVAVIGRGPATANGLHAAVAASRMGSRVLVIYGDAAVGGGALKVRRAPAFGCVVSMPPTRTLVTCFEIAGPNAKLTGGKKVALVHFDAHTDAYDHIPHWLGSVRSARSLFAESKGHDTYSW